MNYKTKITLLGLPLVHVVTGGAGPEGYRRGIAKGWIAIGDISFGVVLSVGGVAFGGISVGGIAVGLLSFGGLALGLLAVGGCAIGLAAAGGAAFGWKAAFGGLAIAREFAQGGSVAAAHANDPVAQDFFLNSRFFTAAKSFSKYSRWCLLGTLIPVFFGIDQWRKRSASQRDNNGESEGR